MIPLFKVTMDATRALKNLEEVLPSGYIGQGAWVDRFEEALAAFLKVEPWQVVTVNSGTSAIQLALALYEVRAEDHVLCSSITCMSDAHTILNMGAEIVWSDADPRTGLMEWPKWFPALSAVLVTDLGGMTPIPEKVREYRVPLIQDAAQNFGGVMYGDIVCYSFQAIKQLTTGDGGCLILKDKDLADKARLMRWFGLDRKTSADFRSAQNIKVPGFKFHMTDIDAAIGLANLPMVPMVLRGAKDNARFYQERLPKEILIPWQETGTYWSYMVLLEDRKGFMDFMAEKGVHTSPVQSIGTKHDLFPKTPLPGAEWYGARNVAIPNGWWVSHEERQYIVDAVIEWCRIERAGTDAI